MAVFRPPEDNVVPPVYVGPGASSGIDPSGWADTTPAIHRLMSRFAARPRGRNVYLLTDNTVTENQPVDWGTVQKVFWGACSNPVTAAEVTILTAAGYGSYIS